LELSAEISNWIIEGLGRSKDLTTRVPMWELLLKMNTNPLIGVGYESFWSGVRFDHIWRQFPGIIQAHNGYLDLYLNIGAIGLLLLLISIADGFAAAIKELESDYATSLLRVAFIIAVVLNNWTEATIKPVSNMFVLLLWGIVDGSSLVEPMEDNEPPDNR
jgi:O-antigen ligase